jgi:hypothetical protein
VSAEKEDVSDISRPNAKIKLEVIPTCSLELKMQIEQSNNLRTKRI